MDNITIYTILLVVLLLVSIRRRCSLVFILILSYYTVVGIMGIIGVRTAGLDTFQEQTSLFPYLFLILCYVIHFSPLMRRNSGFENDKIDAFALPQYNILIYAFLITGIISIVLYIRPVLSLISSGAWRNNRILLLNDEIIYPYSNRIEYIILNFANYFALPTQIVSMVTIAKEEDNKIGWITLIISIVYRVLACIYTSSRGGIFNLAILTIVLLAFFLKDLGKGSKALFVCLGLVGLSIVLPIMTSITVDRFGAGFAGTSIWRYFGQPAIMFGYGVVPIKRLALGKYAFSGLFDTGYSSLDLGGRWNIGGSWGSAFYTFVGFEYIDWGPIGCVLIGFVIAHIMGKVIRKKAYRVSDLYLIFSYIQFLINGCLVIGRNYTIQIIMSLIIYGIMRFFLERSKPLPKIVVGLRRK